MPERWGVRQAGPTRLTGLRMVLLVIVAGGLTFSYTFVAALVPSAVPQAVFVRFVVWTVLVLAGYATYRLAVRHRSLRPLWEPGGSRPAAIVAGAVTATMVMLAIALPPAPQTRLDILRITVVGVIGEEVLFRGLLWEFVDDTHRRRPHMLWMTTVLFAINHVQYDGFHLTQSLVGQLGYTAVAGLILGVVRWRTGTLVWPILLHATGNSLLKLLA